MQRVVKHAVHVHRAEPGSQYRAREVEQIIDDAGGAVGLTADLLQQRVLRVGLGEHAEEHLRVARNAGQRRVDFVRDAGGQKADG